MKSTPWSGAKPSPFPLHRVLVASDLSAASTNAAWRAALLARDHGASLQILHVAWSKSGAVAAQPALDALRWELIERTRIVVEVRAASGDLQRELGTAAGDADLLVLRTNQGRPMRDWLRGFDPERLAHGCRLPVLVVKRPAAVGYKRALVSLDADSPVAGIVAAALGMTRGPYAEVLAALQADDWHGGAPPGCEKLSRDGSPGAALRLRSAVQALIKLHQDASVRSEAPTFAFDLSAAALRAKASSLFADLLVIAQPQPRPQALAVRRSEAAEILASSAADVLLLPLPPSPPEMDTTS